MTKQEFFDIIDSNDEELIKSYVNDLDFINFVKQQKAEFALHKVQVVQNFKDKESKKDKIVSELIKLNKDIVPSIKTLSIKGGDEDEYDEVYEEFNDEPDSAFGNILICSLEYDEVKNKDIFKVNGMYRNVEVNNFQNEQVFILSDGKVEALGGWREPCGEKELEELLKYLFDDDISFVEIDTNVFNTNADYFVMV